MREDSVPRFSNELSDAQLRLFLASGIGPATRRRMLAHFQTPEQVEAATVREIAQIEGIAAKTAASLRAALDDAEVAGERQRMEQHNTGMIFQADADFPALLAQSTDAPDALWIRGQLTHADRLCVAIVGSRKCTAYGREQASRFASLLAQSGLTIVSGGAAGIDGEAHRGALRVKGRTIVVLGCGLARCYPPEHKDLFERVVDEGGAIVSEFPMDTQPRPQHFPRRNRIIAGLSLGVLVVEAAQRSGALITARLASEDNREVMAIPGRVDSPASAGCLQLLRDGGAALVCDHADVLRQLDSAHHLVRGAAANGNSVQADQPASLFDGNLTDEQRSIVEALAEAGESLLVDQIAARTQIPMSRLMADLTLLQIRGRVSRNQRGVELKQ
jgi:DNA processing protein